MKLPFKFNVAVILMHLLSAGIQSQAADVSSLEPWVANCTVRSGDLQARDARAVAGGISMKKYGDWGWSPRLQSAEGVMIVHPVNKSKPAEIKYRIPAPRLGAPKFTRIMLRARGSDYLPGVSMQAEVRGKGVKEVMLGREWQQMVLSIAALPPETTEVVFKIRPLEWLFEYCYIDYIMAQ